MSDIQLYKGLSNKEALVIDKSKGVKFEQLTDGEIIRLIESMLKYLFRDIGIKSNPEPYDATRFMQIIRRYFNELTFEEIKLAFEMALMGELDPWLPKDRNGKTDINHYQSFSVEYYSKILRAFQQCKKSVIQKANVLALPEFHKPTPQEIRSSYLNFLDFILYEYRTTGEIRIINPMNTLEVLKELNLYDGEIEVSEEDQIRAMEFLTKQMADKMTGRSVEYYSNRFRAIDEIKVVFDNLPDDWMFSK
jgi:hypothetical protein